MVHGSELVKMQNLGPHPKPRKSEPVLYLRVILQLFEKHYPQFKSESWGWGGACKMQSPWPCSVGF